MLVIKSPENTSHLSGNKIKVFLAGSIEMGAAKSWQDSVAANITAAIEQQPSSNGRTITADDFILLNPRREDWSSDWKQTRDDPNFYQQVTWELHSLHLADWIILYFDATTKSPISLLELGLFAHSGKLVVICPDGFWRKGNVEIVCETYGIVQRDTIKEACSHIVEQENLKRSRA